MLVWTTAVVLVVELGGLDTALEGAVPDEVPSETVIVADPELPYPSVDTI